MSKRPKHSSTDADNKIVIKQEEEKEDFFNKLPDDLLTKIISCIPDARDAKRTSTSSSNIKVKKFHDSVDKALALRQGMPIQKFVLCFMDEHCDYSRLNNWLRTLVCCLVQQLELNLVTSSMHGVSARINILKNCNTLIELTLRGKFVLDMPESNGVLFPSLKKLNLHFIVYYSEPLMKLISQCPVLEELFVENRIESYYERLNTFKVFSTSLKRLRMSFINIFLRNPNVVINAPNLEYIYFSDQNTTKYHIMNPLSLVEAHINVSSHIFELFTSLSSIKKLILTHQTIREAFTTKHILIREIRVMPLFPNLVKILIGINGPWEWDFLMVLLNHMPNLEHITFTHGLLCVDKIFRNYNPPVIKTPPPSCLLSNMKEIIILKLKAVTCEEVAFIRYLLNTAKNLEIFKMNAPKIGRKRRKEILSFSRGSKCCRVQFV
ncbi:F-box/LRR-repeat protein At3g59190-like [Rutidosis leptorrhynchoides]|uniref:F-box/LRR-repeat protein At3g59190-like n=1 Tax=Rutidosis leptorrhynchoides TaxID=125765 RepID=UPI003A99C346